MLGRLGQTACVLALVAAALAGCGGDDGGGDLAALVPPDAPLYAEATIHPDGDQAAAIESLAERIGGVSDPGGAVVATLDEFLAAGGFDATYAEDVEPWLGDRAGVFVSSFEPTGAGATAPDSAILLEVDDADAAREFLGHVVESSPDREEERSYEGTDYYASPNGFAAGVVGDTALVFATENAFQVTVDSAQGESVAESPEYTERDDELPEDALATVFFEPGETVEAIVAAEGVDRREARMWTPLLDGLLSKPIAAALTATPDAASVDLAARLDTDVLLSADPSLLTRLPGDSWAAIAIPELGRALDHALDQLSAGGFPGTARLDRQVRERTGLDLDAVFGWLGDAAAFVAGTNPAALRAGLIAQTDDPAAAKDLLAALERVPGVDAGVVDDRLVATHGTTVDGALRPRETLGEAPGFRAAAEAFGDDLPPGFYLDLPAFIDVAERGSDGDVDYDAIRPYTDAFAALIAGSRVEGDLVLSRFTVTLAGE